MRISTEETDLVDVTDLQPLRHALVARAGTTPIGGVRIHPIIALGDSTGRILVFAAM
jgi:hypothetical protein